MTVQRANILGVGISAINLSTAVMTIEAWITDSRQNYICVTPVHSIMECFHQPNLYQIFNSSGLTTPDGMPIVWLLRLFGFNNVSRVYGPDLMLEVCSYSQQNNWRHFFYGGAPGIPEKLSERLKARFPGLNVAGTYSPPFRELTPNEDRIIVHQINDLQPDILWIGISSPKQEQWMFEHLGKVSAPVMIGVGAAFDFLSGNKKQAPTWMQKSGLEWAFRLLAEPRRLWRRYLINNPLFITLVAVQILGIKRYTLD